VLWLGYDFRELKKIKISFYEILIGFYFWEYIFHLKIKIIFKKISENLLIKYFKSYPNNFNLLKYFLGFFSLFFCHNHLNFKCIYF